VGRCRPRRCAPATRVQPCRQVAVPPPQKPIALPSHGLHVLWQGGLIGQRGADVTDTGAHHRATHMHALPDLLEEFCPRDESAGPRRYNESLLRL
jgi:hypothetical protein